MSPFGEIVDWLHCRVSSCVRLDVCGTALDSGDGDRSAARYSSLSSSTTAPDATYRLPCAGDTVAGGLWRVTHLDGMRCCGAALSAFGGISSASVAGRRRRFSWL